jgi:pyridoxamine 5'-phosphate oxidase
MEEPNDSVAALRREYKQQGLTEADLAADPTEQFRLWFGVALASNLPEPNAMTVATATPDGRPSARTVLLKGFDERGFVFYTNYRSRKGRELAANPRAALVFYWPELERQIRIEGQVERVSPEESDAYFHSRPPGSQLGAIVSQQSEVIPNRQLLEERMRELTNQYRDQQIPRPAHWGGYRLRPDVIEFWQGRPSRLHDRLRYRKGDDGRWIVERLSP